MTRKLDAQEYKNKTRIKALTRTATIMRHYALEAEEEIKSIKTGKPAKKIKYKEPT